MTEIKTAADAKQRLNELTAAKDLQGKDIVTNTEAVADIRKILQVLSESAHRDVMQETTSDAGITKYMVPEEQRGSGSPIAFEGRRLDDRSWQPGLLDDDEVHGDWHKNLRRIVHRRNWVRLMTGIRDDEHRYGASPQMDRALQAHLRAAPPAIRKIFSDSANAGSEWIPVMHLPQLVEDLRAARRIEALLPSMTVDDKNVRLPKRTTGLRPFIKGNVTTNDPAQFGLSNLGTDEVVIGATGIATRTQIDEDASEDSILAVEPITRAELTAAHTDGKEDAFINGDDSATHQDAIATWNTRSRWGADGLGGTADHRRLWEGWRRRALRIGGASTLDLSDSYTFAKYLATIATLDSPLGVEGSVVLFASPEAFLADLLGLAEVVTVDKLGTQATIRTGQLAQIGRSPVVITEFLTSDLATSGLFTGSGAKTGLLLVNTDRFLVARRRGLRIEQDKDITRGVTDMVSTERMEFITLDDSTKRNVHFGFNL